MPELPEVETIRLALLRLIIGKRIGKVRVLGNRVMEGTGEEEIKERLLGDRIRACLRRGKYLIAQGENFSLLIHFGMSGSLIFYPQGHFPQKHTHITIRFVDQSELHYHDPRTFGRLKLYPLCPPEEIPELAHLGWEPLDGKLALSDLAQKLRRRKAPIKQVIMDQRLIAGIGNIYASEILFHSLIDPLKPTCDLTPSELQRLYRAIPEVLGGAIREGGTSIISFRNAEGKKGGYQNLLQVYARADKGCPRCNTPILNRLLAGRSTYYCPHCQGK